MNLKEEINHVKRRLEHLAGEASNLDAQSRNMLLFFKTEFGGNILLSKEVDPEEQVEDIKIQNFYTKSFHEIHQAMTRIEGFFSNMIKQDKAFQSFAREVFGEKIKDELNQGTNSLKTGRDVTYTGTL